MSIIQMIRCDACGKLLDFSSLGDLDQGFDIAYDEG